MRQSRPGVLVSMSPSWVAVAEGGSVTLLELDKKGKLERSWPLLPEEKPSEFVQRHWYASPTWVRGGATLLCMGHKRFVPLAIVSDGFREYIHLILGRHGLDVPCFANRVEFIGNSLRPVFPYFHLGCRRCANCKGYHVLRYKNAGYRPVFIGDGLSDLCALPHADRILAKGDLAAYCEREGIPHTRIGNLGEALAALSSP